jgi:hypothetical protein
MYKKDWLAPRQADLKKLQTEFARRKALKGTQESQRPARDPRPREPREPRPPRNR